MNRPNSRANGPGPLSPRSVQMCWVILKAAMNWAVKEHKLPTNPLSGKRGPKVEKAVGATIRAWAPDQVQTFLANAKSAAEDASSPEARRSYAVLHALWTLLITSGLRISEALGLEWGDLDATAGLLHVRAQLVTQKGTEAHRGPLKSSNSRRTIPLTAQALDALEGLRKGHPEPLR